MDLGPLLDIASAAFEGMSEEEQEKILKSMTESNERHKRQQIADMESQFHSDHDLSTTQQYHMPNKPESTIRVLITGASGSQHRLQGGQSCVETLPGDECFTSWPEKLLIVNEDGTRDEIHRTEPA